jgi:membrane-associated protein
VSGYQALGRRVRQGIGNRLALVALAAVALLFGLFIVFDWDLADVFGGAPAALHALIRRFGPAAPFGLLYLEESGVPMPVPGDVFVMIAGHFARHHLLGLIATWAGLTAAVTLGASNLYFISSRWGHRLVEGRRGAILHLTPQRLVRAENWFRRWGPWALIVGRHVPGLRVPLTVAAGIFKVPYRIFALSVGVSAATWSAIFLVLGAVVGGRVGYLFLVHREVVLVVALVALAAVVAYAGYRLFARARLGSRQADAPG